MKKISLFKEPYPLSSIKSTVKMSIWVGLFVFVFLYFFRPFGLESEHHLKMVFITFGFGAITSGSIMALSLFGRIIFTTFYRDQHWTLGKEFIVTLLHFNIIGFLNLMYSSYIFHFPVTVEGLIRFQLYTLGVGAFPIAFFIYVRFSRLNQKFLHQALDFNREIHRNGLAGELKSEKLHFTSELKEPEFEVGIDNFLYAESADNYVLIHWLDGNDMKKHLLRTTLSKMEQEVQKSDFIARTHRAYLVNLLKVEDFSGNAQGLRLRLKNADMEIPVSRKMVDEVRNRLQ